VNVIVNVLQVKEQALVQVSLSAGEVVKKILATGLQEAQRTMAPNLEYLKRAANRHRANNRHREQPVNTSPSEQPVSARKGEQAVSISPSEHHHQPVITQQMEQLLNTPSMERVSTRPSEHRGDTALSEQASTRPSEQLVSTRLMEQGSTRPSEPVITQHMEQLLNTPSMERVSTRPSEQQASTRPSERVSTRPSEQGGDTTLREQRPRFPLMELDTTQLPTQSEILAIKRAEEARRHAELHADVHYKVLEHGSKREGRLLMSSMGHSFGVKVNSTGAIKHITRYSVGNDNRELIIIERGEILMLSLQSDEHFRRE
jgi:hypothetical protein